MNRIFSLVAALALISFVASAQTTRQPASIAGPTMAAPIAAETYDGKGWMVRLEPALFYRTMGLQVEKTVADHLSLGLNVLYKSGTSEPRIVAGKLFDENYNKNGFLLEVMGKYYLAAKAPEGFYFQGHLGIGNIIYQDGTFRPMGINTRIVDYKGAQRVAIPDPSFTRYGLGAGYQFLSYSKHLALNLGVGLQMQSDAEGFKSNIYVSPSLGFFF